MGSGVPNSSRSTHWAIFFCERFRLRIERYLRGLARPNVPIGEDRIESLQSINQVKEASCQGLGSFRARLPKSGDRIGIAWFHRRLLGRGGIWAIVMKREKRCSRNLFRTM